MNPILFYEFGKSRVKTFAQIAQLTNPTHISAVNYLESELKAKNLWGKMLAVYPFVGGNAHAHKFNLIDPRDMNEAFRLDWVTNLQIHAETGMNPNKYPANTFMNALQHIPQNSGHLSYYSRTHTTLAETQMGQQPASPPFMLTMNWSNLNYSRLNTTGITTFTPGRGDYFAIASRTGAAVTTKWMNGAKKSTQTSASATQSSATMTIGAGGITGGNYPTTMECGFASIGLGLTDSECFDLDAIVQQYNTMLGREISRI